MSKRLEQKCHPVYAFHAEICSHQVWIRLLIGELSAPTAFATHLLEASTPSARHIAEALFPQLRVWHSAWDQSIDL